MLDYAGGGPIEICSGVTGLVYSIFLGKRRGFGTHILSFKPHNVSYVIQGTIFLWGSSILSGRNPGRAG